MGTQLPTIQELINETIAVDKTRLAPFIKVYLASLLIGIFSLIVIGSIALLGTVLISFKLPAPIIIPIILLITLVILVFNITISGIATILAIADEPFVGVIATFKKAWAKAGAFFSVGLVVGLLTFVGLLVFVIPGILVALTFFLAPYLVLFENYGVQDVLKESERRTNGKRLNLFVLNLVFFGAVFLIPFAFGMVSKALGKSALALIVDLINLVVSIVLTPAQIIIPYLLYKHLKPVEQIPTPIATATVTP